MEMNAFSNKNLCTCSDERVKFKDKIDTLISPSGPLTIINRDTQVRSSDLSLNETTNWDVDCKFLITQ